MRGARPQKGATLMSTPPYDPSILQNLQWRCIGPPRGGRVVAVAGDPVNPMTAYFGAVAGGVWKTTDGGTYWENVSDGFFNTASIGALAVAPSDPNVIYAGTGETTIRLDVSYGDGVYKSTDAGKTWTHMGLEETHHIGEIRIHPHNPDLVYVAALGHAFGPNPERGVYRSDDGGRTWEKVLYRSDKAGAVDLAMDPNNPRLLYASIWEAYRNFWSLSSGGPDSGLFKSTDGGDTWTEISNNQGLPKGIKGKIGVAVSPAQADRVWAIVEAEQEGLYRSDDGGQEWQRVSDNRDLMHRPWYYCHVFADPQQADTVYVTNLKMWKSTDGGRHFAQVTTPHGDNHDLWIDPRDPRHLVQGNDGGACVSFNGGQSWSTIYNQLTAQLYRIDIDNQFPYRVYATQQDNASICVPSATEYGAITWSHCFSPGTGESGFIAVHPQNPDVVYLGAVGSSPGGNGVLQRYDRKTRQIRLVNVWPEESTGWAPKDLKYRFCLDLPHCHFTARRQCALCRRQHPFPQSRRGQQLASHQSGPVPGRPQQAGGFRRPHYQGRQRGRAIRHPLYLCGIGPRKGRVLGRHRRRTGPPLARRRRPLEQQDSPRTAGLGLCRLRRSLPPRSGIGLCFGHPLQAR